MLHGIVASTSPSKNVAKRLPSSAELFVYVLIMYYVFDVHSHQYGVFHFRSFTFIMCCVLSFILFCVLTFIHTNHTGRGAAHASASTTSEHLSISWCCRATVCHRHSLLSSRVRFTLCTFTTLSQCVDCVDHITAHWSRLSTKKANWCRSARPLFGVLCSVSPVVFDIYTHTALYDLSIAVWSVVV